jgi:hypothetical protein
MEKPKLSNFVEPIKRNGVVFSHGINFTHYAFALEKYVSYLEQQLKETGGVKRDVK